MKVVNIFIKPCFMLLPFLQTQTLFS